jgi:hypothetical protein
MVHNDPERFAMVSRVHGPGWLVIRLSTGARVDCVTEDYARSELPALWNTRTEDA